MNQDSLSMTPPSSPLMQTVSQPLGEGTTLSHVNNVMNSEEIVSTENESVSFCCCGEASTSKGFSHHSYIQRRGLQRCLEREDNSKPLNLPCIDLFGTPFLVSTALHEQIDVLFFLARQTISSLEMSKETVGHPKDLMQIRTDLRGLFDYVQLFIQRYSCEFKLQLLNQLCGLLLHLGPLCEVRHSALMNAPLGRGNESCSTDHHFFHLCLEVNWAVIEISHMLSMKYPEESIMEKVSESTYLLLSNIAHLACKRFNQLPAHEWFCTCDGGAFHCGCVVELCVMLRHVTDYRQHQMARESYLSVLQRVAQDILHEPISSAEQPMEIDSDCTPLPAFDCRDKLGFCWWFLANMIGVLKYDAHGEPSIGVLERHEALHYIVLDLVKKSCKAPEAELRRYLRFVLLISQSLPSKMTVITTLWEVFYKRLNDTFRSSASHVRGLATIQGSASALFDQSQSIVRNDLQSGSSLTSFVLFLHLLCLEVQKSDKKGAANPNWKSIRGRFYSKFHTRRMQEFSELGLQNFGLLFLCLAQVADTEELVSKMCEHYSSLPVASLDTRKRMAVWRGSFAAMLLCCEHGLNMSFLAEKLVASLNAVASALSESHIEPTRYAELWHLVQLYTESAQDVLECSRDLDLHQYALIGQGYQQVLAVCRESDLRFLLQFALAVLTKLRLLFRQTASSNRTSSLCALADLLWKHFYLFVKTHSYSLTPPPQVADLAVGFALLCADLPPSGASGVTESLNGCFTFFSCNDKVNAKVTCRFLGHILPDTVAMETLSRSQTCLETSIVRAWIRCAWHLDATCPDLLQLGKLIEKRIGMQSLTKSLLYDSPLLSFIHRLGLQYDSCQSLKERMEFRKVVTDYFQDVGAQLPAALHACAVSDQVTHMYEIAGFMVKYCAQIIYLQSKPDCILPVLIDRLVLPRSLLITGKTLPTHIQLALKRHLHLYLVGLGRLDFKRDQYIGRKIREIIAHFLPRFSLTGLGVSAMSLNVHPLLVALDSECWSDVIGDVSAFRAYVINMVKAEHLTIRGVMPPQHASAAWHFISEVFNRAPNFTVIAQDSVLLLRTCLEYNLVVEVPHVKQQANRVLQTLLEAMSKYPDACDIQTLSAIMRSFVCTHLALYMTRVLKALEPVAIHCAAILIPCISVITEAIRAAEKKRGVGVDKQLRVAYYKLLSYLGEPGSNEKARLLLH